MSSAQEEVIEIPDSWFPQFCPRCGGEITNRNEARIVNPTNGKRVPGLCAENHQTWVSPNPVTIGLVFWRSDSGEVHILVEQRGIEPQRDKWAFVAGFMEPGHSAWQTVKKEAKEEVGLCLRNAQGVIIDQLPSPGSPMLLLTFIGVLARDGGSAPTLTPDGEETLAARWLQLSQLTTENEELSWAFPWQLALAHQAAGVLGLN